MKTIYGHNGVRLNIRTAGDPGSPALLLIHGWSQHSLSWQFQMSDLSRRYFVVAPDLRGHGDSDKPDAPEAYNNSAPWAGDIHAIIDQLGLKNPMLVGWSMGGWIVGDYLRVHGTAKISSIALVGSSITTGRSTPGGASEKRDEDVRAPGMQSSNQAINIVDTTKFVRACTAAPLDPSLFAQMVGLNMLVPPHIRDACRKRHEDYRDTYRTLDIPALILWGDQERVALPPYMDEMMDVIPTAEACCLAGLGHAPMIEDPKRFNTALLNFADGIQKRKRAA